MDLTSPIRTPITPQLQARIDKFKRVLRQYDRVALGGVHMSGKGVFARFSDGRRMVHTDDYIDRAKAQFGKGHWDGLPRLVNQDLTGCSRFLLVGIRSTGCIESGLPVQALVWLPTPMDGSYPTPKLRSAAKGRQTRFERFRREHRGLPVIVC